MICCYLNRHLHHFIVYYLRGWSLSTSFWKHSFILFIFNTKKGLMRCFSFRAHYYIMQLFVYVIYYLCGKLIFNGKICKMYIRSMSKKVWYTIVWRIQIYLEIKIFNKVLTHLINFQLSNEAIDFSNKRKIGLFERIMASIHMVKI